MYLKCRKWNQKTRDVCCKVHSVCCFGIVRDKTFCIIYRTVMPTSRWSRNLTEHKFGVLKGKLREDKWKNLKCNILWQQTVFSLANKKWSRSWNKFYHIRNNHSLIKTTCGWRVCEGVFDDGSRFQNKIWKDMKILNPVIFTLLY